MFSLPSGIGAAVADQAAKALARGFGRRLLAGGLEGVGARLSGEQSLELQGLLDLQA